MKRMKFLLVTAVVCLASPVQAGIPTADIPGNIRGVVEFIQTIEQWKKELEMYQKQFQQMEQQVKAITGGRGLGVFGLDPKFKNYLPEDWRDAYEGLKKGGKSGLSGKAKEIYDGMVEAKWCDNHTDADVKQTCQAKVALTATKKMFFDDAQKKATERTTQIQSLLQKAGTTKDDKEIAEIQARIQGEVALLQNEQMKIDMFEKYSAIEEESLRLESVKAREKFERSRMEEPDVMPEKIKW